MLQQIVERLNTKGWKVLRVLLFVSGAFLTLGWCCIELYHSPAIQDADLGRVMIWMAIGFFVTAIVYGWLEIEKVYIKESGVITAKKPGIDSETVEAIIQRIEEHLKEDIDKAISEALSDLKKNKKKISSTEN